MRFECVYHFPSEPEADRWSGRISQFTRYPSHSEIWIISRSSIMVLFGETSRGYFACMPDFNVGCHLVDFKDLFWNKERLIEVLGPVDGTTVAMALHSIADQV